MLNPNLRGMMLAVALALAGGACGKTAGVVIDDTTITTRVKTAMLNDTAVGGLRIDVETLNGVVTLSGRVESRAERDQVIAMARGIDGVVEVNDALQVMPEANPD